MRIPLVALLLLVAVVAPRAAHGQFRDQLFTAVRPDTLAAPSAGALVLSPRQFGSAQLGAEARDGGRHPLWLAGGGVMGAGLGLMTGMVVGAVLDGPADEDCIDFCFGPGLVGGALVGEIVGMALGVHLANGRRGSLLTDVIASTGIIVVGGFIGQDSPEVLLVLPIGQLIGTIYSERSTARRRR